MPHLVPVGRGTQVSSPWQPLACSASLQQAANSSKHGCEGAIGDRLPSERAELRGPMTATLGHSRLCVEAAYCMLGRLKEAPSCTGSRSPRKSMMEARTSGVAVAVLSCKRSTFEQFLTACRHTNDGSLGHMRKCSGSLGTYVCTRACSCLHRYMQLVPACMVRLSWTPLYSARPAQEALP